ncbi:MAG: hypothetical protein ACLUZZ_05215 [Alistipes inops]
MNHTVAEEDLKVISGLLEEWRKTGRLGGLEYDLLLDKIKSLYETVRFGGGQHDESTPCREAASVGSREPEPSVSAGVFPLEPTEAHTAAYQRPGGTTVRALYDDGEDGAHRDRPPYFVTEPVAAENLQGAAKERTTAQKHFRPYRAKPTRPTAAVIFPIPDVRFWAKSWGRVSAHSPIR